MNRSDLRAALAHPNVRAFNAVRDLGEHGPNADDPDRYRTMFGGEKFDAPPWEHPRRKITRNGITSTAAGGPQFLAGTWDEMARKYGFEDFSPGCQEEAAVGLYVRRGALDDIIAGRFEDAIRKCAKEWASLPGSPYGQPTLTMDRARDRYLERGGYLSAADPLASEHYGEAVTESVINPVPSPDEQEAHMALPIIPLLTAFGPELVKLIPQFASMFGSGSTVQIRNAKAAEMAVSAVVEAVKAPNLQAAIETMQSDPQAAKAAQIAAADVLALIEVGGGITEARKANAEASQIPILQDRSFLVTLLLFTIPVMLLVDVFYVHPGAYDSAIRTQIVTACLIVISIIGGYWLGSSAGSAKKTALLGKE